MPNTELELTTPFEVNPSDTNKAASPAHDDSLAVRTSGGAHDIRYLCRHIFTDGRRCGSPALKTQNFCYYHYAHRPHLRHMRDDRKRKTGFDLDCLDGLDNHTSVQLALAEVATRVAANSIDGKRAALLLYALKLAGQNLRHAKTTENSVPVAAVTEDPTFGHLAEIEPGRPEPETLISRLLKPKPFTGYDKPYEIPPDLQETLDDLESTRVLARIPNPH